MAYLRCTGCGRMLDSINFSKIGLRCGVGGCNGVFEFAGGYYVYPAKGAKLDLKCYKCGSVCSSAVTKLKVGSRCPIKGCDGRLDRFHGA